MPRKLRVESRGDMLYRVAPISLDIEGEDIVAYLQIEGTLTDVGIGCGDEEGLLLSGDGRASFGKAPDAARLDLSNDERLTPLGDDVDLTVLVAPIPLEDGVAVALQIAAG
jgi:hypothetical protein